MTKRKALILLVLVEALVYAFIIWGIPAIYNSLNICQSCQSSRSFVPPTVLYFVPFAIGVFFGVIIIRKKEGVTEK